MIICCGHTYPMLKILVYCIIDILKYALHIFLRLYIIELVFNWVMRICGVVG